MKRFAIVSLLTGAAAFGQSFNVDVNVAAAPGAGVPASSFIGAAGQAGTWNAMGSNSSLNLVGLNGVGTGATLTRSGGGALNQTDNSFIGGDFEKLVGDYFHGNTGTTLTYTFANLDPGTYVLYTYAINPSSTDASVVNVSGSTSRTNQTAGNIVFNENFWVGSTHTIHVKNLSAGGSLVVTIAPPQPNMAVNVAGFQLAKIATPLLRMYVNDNAAGANVGTDWANAFVSPQSALRVARAAGGQNCEIWVANGFYKTTLDLDRYASFDIPDHLKMYGGFNGNETSLSQRPSFSLSYLDGGIGTSSDTDNAYTVLVANNTSSDTLIDGFFVIHGHNDDLGNGGGVSLQGGSATFRNCSFSHNWALDYGGGVYVSAGTPTFVDCTFYSNQAFRGSAIYMTSSTPTRMYNCEMLDNDTYDGTVYFDGGLGTLGGCFLHGNYAGGSGGAVHAYGAIVTIANCTIAGNAAGSVVGGVYARSGSPVGIQNSILWGNTDQFSATTLEKQYDNDASSTITVTASTAQGAAGSAGLDPLFVDGNGADNVWGGFDDNCHLQPNSPCIDLGSNASVPADLGDVDQDGNTAEALPLDIDGLTRIRNTVVDKGAFEYQPPCNIPGDLNHSGAVDLTDLATLLSHFGTANGATAAQGDITGDGAVSLDDLAILLSHFGSTCP